MSAEISQLKKIIEGAVLASPKPISYEKIMALFEESAKPNKSELVKAFKALQEDYQERGIELQEVASGLRFQVSKSVTTWVSRLQEERPQRYSRALLETIAIIAYRQPITRGGIEEVRGVAVSSQIIRTLQEREWVRVVGHLDVPGRPALYATTKQFLDYFNLKNLNELPPLSEIKDLEQLNRELELEADTREKLEEMIEEEKQAAEKAGLDEAVEQEGEVEAGDESLEEGSEESSEKGGEEYSEEREDDTEQDLEESSEQTPTHH
jgi:segregation and condensation protein B